MQTNKPAAQVDRDAGDPVSSEGSEQLCGDEQHRGVRERGQAVWGPRDVTLSNERPGGGPQGTPPQRHQLPQHTRQIGQLERISTEVRGGCSSQGRLGVGR